MDLRVGRTGDESEYRICIQFFLVMGDYIVI